MTDELLTTRELARRWNMSHRTIEDPRSATRKKLDAAGAVVHFGRMVRIRGDRAKTVVDASTRRKPAA